MEFKTKIFVIYLLFLSSINALVFYLPPNTVKCFNEEIHKDILVSGEYVLTEIVGQYTKLEVRDSNCHIFFNKDDAKSGKFAFTTNEFDIFSICFQTALGADVRGTDGVAHKEIYLDIKHGSEAKNYDNVRLRD
jgi:hypothetical protein